MPALAGLGAPHWRPEARGLFAGIDRGTTAAHLARAALEGMALQIHDLAEAMQARRGRDIPALQGRRRRGGQRPADAVPGGRAGHAGGAPAEPGDDRLGAAFLAGLGAGVWSSPDAIRRAWKADKRFKPKMKPEERERHLAKWRRAVERA